MNEFRDRLLSGKSLRDPLLAEKKKGAGRAPRTPASEQAASPDQGLGDVAIPREAARTVNQRDGERHRLLRDEQAVATWKRKKYPAEIINLSGGGAMIAVDFQPRLWDRLLLSLGGCGELECAVIWIKSGRIGLEFAHETRIDADPESRATLLREVIARSFPHVDLPAPAPAPEPAPTPEPTASSDSRRREDRRHPLIWRGEIHYDYASTPVRLRNVSAVGALVEAAQTFPVGAELLLDLGEGGQVFATVQWARGDQTGLRFHDRFDVQRLAKVKPEVAPARWVKPEYLRDSSTETSPWASEWGRLTVEELNRTLKR